MGTAHGVPQALTVLVGRERETASVCRLLVEGRLLTLTGPGGCGKTRLAAAVATAAAAEFDGGSWWVELAPLTDPGLILSAVGTSLGLRERPGTTLFDTVVLRLGQGERLLVMDNCEHLIDACAPMVENLLARCPDLRVLATSREPLGLNGERSWPVPSLSIPDSGNLPPLTSLPRYDAVRLLVQRMVQIDPGFVLDAGNAMAVARVCQRLDGLPLALELAAARTRVLGIAEVAARLEVSFGLLTGGSRTALPRQRTLRASIDWSHELLDGDERVVFRRLSVFAGGFTLEAAETVCTGTEVERFAVLDLLMHLVQKSLVLVTKPGGHARYRLLEAVQEFGRERLDESGEEPEIRSRHGSYYLQYAEQIEPKINTGERWLWIQQLAVERDNFRAALEWSRRIGDDTGPRLAGALLYFWFFGSQTSEGRRWLDGSVAALRKVENHSERALARAVVGAGLLAWVQGDYPVAHTALEEAVALFRQLGDRVALAHALRFLSSNCESEGDLVRARTLVEESLSLFRGESDPMGTAITLARLGITAVNQRDHLVAGKALEESITLARQIGDQWVLALALRHRGIEALRQHDTEAAVAALTEGLVVVRDQGDRFLSAQSLETLAEVYADAGDHGRAARLFGALEALREALSISVIYSADYTEGVAATRTATGAAAFAAAWASGRELTLDAAIALALQPPQPSTEKTEQPLLGLTGREEEVLTLVARGMTNTQVAGTLFLSARTVNWHLTAIYSKLGVTSRTEAVRVALDHGLR